MGKKNKLIPFHWLPGSWGLAGEPFEIAKAHYELEGQALERRLIDLTVRDATERELAHLKLDHDYGLVDDYEFDIEEARIKNNEVLDPIAELDIKLKHKKIDGWEHDCAVAAIQFPDESSLERQIALLTADYTHGQIDKLEYDKTLAIAKNEPWVGIVDNGFNSEDGVNGLYFELDWNDQWVEHLRKNGYHGVSDEQIVEQWFSDVCRSQAEETPVDDDSPVPFNSGRVINRRRGDNGTEYS